MEGLWEQLEQLVIHLIQVKRRRAQAKEGSTMNERLRPKIYVQLEVKLYSNSVVSKINK